MISKAKLGEFTSLTIFSDEYLLVERKGLFNLIDQNGDYISNTWYKEIKKNNGGGADFVEVKTNNRVQLRSVPLIATYGQVRTALNNTAILSRIDTRCIAVVTPYKVFSNNSSRYVTIIAKVTIFGKELLLGKNGKLYESNGDGIAEEYNMPEFFISLTDINRLVDVADNFNCTYNSDYNVSNKRIESGANTLKETHTSCWIFGFDNSGKMEFNSSTKCAIRKTDVTAWGGDTIKLRIDSDIIPELYRDKLIEEMKDMDFEEWTKSDHNWWTKIYELDELNDLFDDMKMLCDKLSYRKC